MAAEARRRNPFPVSDHEAISQPYRFDVELISERADFDLASLLHQCAFLAFSPNGDGIHYIVQSGLS